MSYVIAIAILTVVIIIIGMSMAYASRSCSSEEAPACVECGLGKICSEHGETSKSGPEPEEDSQ